MAYTGIIRGVSATRFEPQRNITRAETATLIDWVVWMVLGNARQIGVLRTDVKALQDSIAEVAHLQFQTRARFSFVNTTGHEVNDLHIWWRDGIHLLDALPTPFGLHSGNGTFRHDFSRGTVAKGETIEFWFGSTGNRLAIREWYWTEDGQRVGPVRQGHSDNVD